MLSMLLHPFAVLALALLLGGVAPSAHANIYMFVDADGRVHMADRQIDARYQLAVSDTGGASAPPVSAPVARLDKSRHNPLIAQAAQATGLPHALVAAVISVESGFNEKAVSPKGAKGLMQLMPGTAKRFGVTDVFDPAENIKGGTAYLKHLLALFNNDVSLTLAAYNAGEEAVARYGRKIPPFPETQKYVQLVLARYQPVEKKDAKSAS